MENLTNDKDAALIVLDQSKAYDVIAHDILLGKLRLLGYTNQAITIMASFLAERKQFVQVQGSRSEVLVTGPNSVIQGSVLSSALYLIYVLDTPLIFHDTKHEPLEYRKCSRPSIKTFVDDNYTIVKKSENKDLNQSVKDAMESITEYMTNNKLALNQSKSKIMIISKEPGHEEELQHHPGQQGDPSQRRRSHPGQHSERRPIVGSSSN